MTNDINNFISLDTLKNGRVKISQTVTQKANIYKLLHDLAYCRVKLNNRSVYVKREAELLIPINRLDIKRAFFNFLDNVADFTNIPDGINRTQIINWFYQKNAVKENSLYSQYLDDILTEKEVHTLSMLVDQTYKHNFEVNHLLSKFDEWNFSKTVDIVGAFRKDDNLYYKNIGDKKYLVFHHFMEKQLNTMDCFECWVATYMNENQIGHVKPTQLRDIRLGFDIDKDFNLIKDYLTN